MTVEQGGEIAITEGDEIDLGLSRKWARVNIGAVNPEDRGNLFAWGEIQTRADNKRFASNNYTIEYYYKPSGNFDTRTRLSDDDDAATQILGNKWRMPTQEEINELLFSITTLFPFNYKDNNGLLVIANNGNTLFVPASGYKLGYQWDLDDTKDIICFWTSDVASDDSQASCLMFHIANSTVPYLPFISPNTPMMIERFGGLPVRAVRRADIKIGELQAEVTENSAKLSVSYDLDGIDVSKIQKAGFLYSATGNFKSPETVDSLFCTPNSTGMNLEMTNLSSSSTYKVRPFLIVEKEGNYTADVYSFTTKDEAKPEQWTDLGLSVLWASWNIGAANPGEYGDVFQWGDIEPKDLNINYIYNNYKYYIPNSHKKYEYWENGKTFSLYYHDQYTKYYTSDKLNKLLASDDAAIEYWGDGARTPSYNEMKELVDNCTFEEVTKYGRRGILVKSNINGASIFLCSNEIEGMYLEFWTSELKVEQIDIYLGKGYTTISETLYNYSNAYILKPHWDSGKLSNTHRSTAAAIRAVKDK